MNGYSRRIQWLVWGILLFTAVSILLVFLLTSMELRRAKLPIYGPVGEFTLTNQLNQPITLASLRGQVWVADVIFTTCPGPCLRMSQRMSELRAAVPSTKPVKFVSLTAYPEFDTPEVLARYSKRFGPEDDRWWFLTGPKREVYRLAIDELKLGITQISPAERKNIDDLFIHSTYFVLVDKQGRLRGPPFEGTDPATPRKILEAINRLLREK